MKEKDLKIKYAYNDKELAIKKRKEIAKLRKQINVIKENYKEEEKNIEINVLINLMEKTSLTNDKKRTKKIKKYFKPKSINKSAKKRIKLEKKIDVDEINKNILEIEKMNLEDYLNHLREKEGKKIREELSEENNGDEESTIDEAIIKIKNLRNFQDNNIKYDLEF